MNDNYDKEILVENTSNLQSQKNLTCEFSSFNKVATEKEEVMWSLGSLKLRNVNFNSIRNKCELLFSLV